MKKLIAVGLALGMMSMTTACSVDTLVDAKDKMVKVYSETKKGYVAVRAALSIVDDDLTEAHRNLAADIERAKIDFKYAKDRFTAHTNFKDLHDATK